MSENIVEQLAQNGIINPVLGLIAATKWISDHLLPLKSNSFTAWNSAQTPTVFLFVIPWVPILPIMFARCNNSGCIMFGILPAKAETILPVKWFPCLDHDPKKHREIFINSNPLPFVTLDEIQRWRLGLQNEMEVDL
ncbi:hypothetical protein IJT17_03510, partial [bacterium]|nr:hypothetical protein [bacterium]